MLDAACFSFLALIQLLPAAAAIAPSQLARLYGIEATDRTLITLLQHRAVLLGTVGFAFLAAVFRPAEAIAWHAVLLGTASMVSFLAIALINKQFGGALRKIAIADALGLVPLGWLYWRQPWAASF